MGVNSCVLAELLQNSKVKKCEYIKAMFIQDVQTNSVFKKVIRMYVFYTVLRKQLIT